MQYTLITMINKNAQLIAHQFVPHLSQSLKVSKSRLFKIENEVKIKN
jgi:hypothetical protein